MLCSVSAEVLFTPALLGEISCQAVLIDFCVAQILDDNKRRQQERSVYINRKRKLLRLDQDVCKAVLQVTKSENPVWEQQRAAAWPGGQSGPRRPC